MSGIKEAKRRAARRRRRKKCRRLLILILIPVLFAGIITGTYTVARKMQDHMTAKDQSKHSNPNTQELTIDQTSGDSSSKEEVSLTISSMGDCTLGTDANFNQSTSLNAYYDMTGLFFPECPKHSGGR